MSMVPFSGRFFNVQNELHGLDGSGRVFLCRALSGSRWEEKKRMSKALAARFLRAPMEDARRIGRSMAKCSDVLGLQWCPSCGTYHVSRAFLCKGRLCPVCSWRRSATRAAEMMKVADALAARRPECKAAMLTLTVKSCTVSELRAVLGGMLRGWGLLIKRPHMRRYIVGAARSVEITRSAETGLYHPHIHALLIFDESYSLTMPQLTARDFVAAWQECLGLAYAPVCDVRFAYSVDEDGGRVYGDLSRAIAETSKYITKSSDLDGMPDEELWAYALALKGLRFYGYSGLIAEIRHELRMKDDALEVSPVMECPRCSSTGLMTATVYWASRSCSYVAAAVDGAIADTIAEWDAAARESREAALRAEPLILRRQLSAALAKTTTKKTL